AMKFPPKAQAAGNVPQSWAHLSLAGSLNETFTLTGEAQTIPVDSGDNPYQLGFTLGPDQAGRALLLRVYNYVGPGHYPLHGGYTPHDDVGVWTASDQFWYM